MDFANLPRRRLIQGAAATAAAAGLGGLAATPAQAAQYPTTHWIPADPSNYTVSSRPTSYPLDFVVVHVTQEYFQDAVDIFQNPSRDVSSHYLIASADGYIAQLVREKDIAWHMRQLELQHPQHRHRARGLGGQARLVHGRDVPAVGATDRRDLHPLRHPAHPRPHHRPQRGPRRHPHRPRPQLELDEVHGAGTGRLTHGAGPTSTRWAAQGCCRSPGPLFRKGQCTSCISLA